ncbi:FtsX-like permease family protein [Longispora albida]|uniref:FtsX-like permease family protein n=1 Tax=Longispora albida TaxID=203523 RepID=UPI0003822799|nr:FtsX-like permease family protein [Longispora albida]
MRLSGGGTGTFRLALSGLWHRRGSSLLVMLLVAVSVAAAVFAPGYSRAVEQWSLRQGMASAVPANTVATVTELWTGERAKPAADTLAAAERTFPLKEFFGKPITEYRLNGRVAFPGDGGVGRLVWRDGQCEHLTIVEGTCPSAPGELLANANAKVADPKGGGLRLGVPVDVTAGPLVGTGKIVGFYREKRDPAYWIGREYFDYGPPLDERGPYNFGTFFTVGEGVLGARRASATVSTGRSPSNTFADYPINPRAVDLNNVDQMLTGLRKVFTEPGGCDAQGRCGSRVLMLQSNVSAVMSDVQAQRESALRAVLYVTVQLIALCWLVVYLILANLAEARSAELAVAKLRGFSTRRVLRFGLNEALLLVALGGPLGAALGWGLVLLGTRAELGALAVRAELRPPVLIVGGAVLLGAVGVAVLASAGPLRRPVLALLRRVSSGLRRRFGFLDAGLVVVAGVTAYTLVLEGPDSQLGLFAGSVAALTVGALTGRLIAMLARRRAKAGVSKGRPVQMLAWSGIGRRPGGPRTVALVVVATSLLVYGLFSWGMASHNREIRAGVVTGAPVVYQLGPVKTDKLLAAVQAADPDGRNAMAASSTVHTSGTKTLHLVGVDTSRLAGIGFWNDSVTGLSVGQLAAKLKPAADGPIVLKGQTLEAELDVRSVQPPGSVTLVALLDLGAGVRKSAVFGQVPSGKAKLTAELPGCAQGCRLLGFDLYRGGGKHALANLTGDLVLTALRNDGEDLTAHLRLGDGWRGAEPTTPTQPVAAAEGTAEGLNIKYTSAGTENLQVLHNDYPYPMPAAVSTPDYTGDFKAAGVYGAQQQYREVVRAPTLPGAAVGILVDLAYADRSASSTDTSATVTSMVWARADAPADLPAKLAAAGLTIVDTVRLDQRQAALDDQGSSVALRLYLFAAAGALLLGLAGVPLTARPGAGDRTYETAALRVAGLSGRQVRRAALREYLILLGAAGFAGAAAGTATAVLTLPYLLPASGLVATVPVDYWPGPARAGVVLGLIVAGYGLVALTAVRTTMRRGLASRLREGAL